MKYKCYLMVYREFSGRNRSVDFISTSVNEGYYMNFFLTFLNLSLKLMQWYVTSVSRGSLYEKVGNKCMKILKFWRTELSYAENKNRGKKMLRLGMDTCPSLNDIMKIRCNKCTRSEQGYDF